MAGLSTNYPSDSWYDGTYDHIGYKLFNSKEKNLNIFIVFLESVESKSNIMITNSHACISWYNQPCVALCCAIRGRGALRETP